MHRFLYDYNRHCLKKLNSLLKCVTDQSCFFSDCFEPFKNLKDRGLILSVLQSNTCTLLSIAQHWTSRRRLTYTNRRQSSILLLSFSLSFCCNSGGMSPVVSVSLKYPSSPTQCVGYRSNGSAVMATRFRGQKWLLHSELCKQTQEIWRIYPKKYYQERFIQDKFSEPSSLQANNGFIKVLGGQKRVLKQPRWRQQRKRHLTSEFALSLT